MIRLKSSALIWEKRGAKAGGRVTRLCEDRKVRNRERSGGRDREKEREGRE